MSENHKKVECCNHGLRNEAYVCQHLVTSEFNGFWESFDSDSTKEYVDGELNAWCNECDKVLVEQGEWNDISEAFAKIELVCDACFFEMKELNGGSSNFTSK
jgi:hypothetical protein